MKNLLNIVGIAVTLTFSSLAVKAEVAATNVAVTNAVPAKADPAAGDKAWEEVEKALKPPPPPAEWTKKPPTNDEIRAFNETVAAPAMGGAIDKLREFYTKFPQHPKAAEARSHEYDLLQMAVQMGMAGRAEDLEARKKERLKNGSASDEERFYARMMEIQKDAEKKATSRETFLVELEKGVRQVQKEFPQRNEYYELLFMVLHGSTGEKARALAKEIMESNADEQFKVMSAALLKNMDRLGKPLVIKFKAVDGREVDTTKMTNKVVLIDFWATWCGPCVAELPHVKDTYDKLHAKGFEVIGISLDSDKEQLQNFTSAKKMEWPQHFDGEGWQGEYGNAYGITGIPTMWLVDKKGNLRDVNAQEELTSKVEKMLAE